MHNLKELKIWQRAIDLATNVYKLTAHFPADERYGLTAQIRKSAVSVPSNIAEGAVGFRIRNFVIFLLFRMDHLLNFKHN